MKVYDYSQIGKLRHRYGVRTAIYVLTLLCWACVCTAAVLLLKDLLWLSITLCGVLTFLYTAGSAVFWQVSQKRLKRYFCFLENVRTGDVKKRLVTYKGQAGQKEKFGLLFNCYNVTDANGGDGVLYAEHTVSVALTEGKTYLVECAGEMLTQYEEYAN